MIIPSLWLIKYVLKIFLFAGFTSASHKLYKRKFNKTYLVCAMLQKIKLPKSIYIHYPFCKKKCHYCDFPIHAVGKNPDNLALLPSYSESYIKNLLSEMKLTFEYIKPAEVIDTIYIGGGTPSLMQPSEFQQILNTIKEYTKISDKAEISMEFDSGTFDKNKLHHFADLGVNRISVGVQTFDDNTLQNIGRSHSLDQVYEAIDAIGSIEKFKTFDNVSLDLILGLPNQSEKTWKHSLKEAMRIRSGHLSVYFLTLEENAVFTRKNKYKDGHFPLPSDEALERRYFEMHAELGENGYEHYEISSFARNSLRSKHNSMYWKGDEPFFGFGMGATSLLQGERVSRPRSLQKYKEFVETLPKFIPNFTENALQQLLSDYQDEKVGSLEWLRSIITGRMRTSEGLDLSHGNLSPEFKSKVFDFITAYEDMDIIEVDREHERVKFKIPKGFILSNEFLSRFFLFLDEHASEETSSDVI